MTYNYDGDKGAGLDVNDLFKYPATGQLNAQAAGLNLEELKEYLGKIKSRVEDGAIEYGKESEEDIDGQSFGEMMHEIEQEVLDIAGWGFLVWRKFNRLQRKLKS